MDTILNINNHKDMFTTEWNANEGKCYHYLPNDICKDNNEM